MADQSINLVPKAALALALLFLPVMTATVLPAAASEVGQYVVTPRPNCANRVECALIVDTKNGYVWQWFPGSVTYEGQAIPGRIQQVMTPQKKGEP